MIYKLRDDYDYTITGLLITDKPVDEVQDLINEARNADDGYWDTMMHSLEENGVEYVSLKSLKEVLY